MSYEQKQQFKERIFRHILELDAESLKDLLKEPIPYDNLNDVRYSAPVVPVSIIYDKETEVGLLNGDVPLDVANPGTVLEQRSGLWSTALGGFGGRHRYPHILIHYDGLNPFKMLKRLWNVCHRPPNCGEIGYLPNGRQIFDLDSTNSYIYTVHNPESEGILFAEGRTTYSEYILPMMNVLYVHMDTNSLGERFGKNINPFGNNLNPEPRWGDVFYERTTPLCDQPSADKNFKYYKNFPGECSLLKWASTYANIAVIKHILKFRPLTMDEITLSIEYNRYYAKEDDMHPVARCEQRVFISSDFDEFVSFDFSKSVAHHILQECTKELVNTFCSKGFTIWSTLFHAEDVVHRPTDYKQWIDTLLEMGADPNICRLKTYINSRWSDEFKQKREASVPKNAYEQALECTDDECEAVWLGKHLWKRRLVELDPKRWPTVDDFDDISVEELKAMYEGHPLVVELEQDEPPAKKRKI
jgi:hypothetical protein